MSKYLINEDALDTPATGYSELMAGSPATTDKLIDVISKLGRRIAELEKVKSAPALINSASHTATNVGGTTEVVTVSLGVIPAGTIGLKTKINFETDWEMTSSTNSKGIAIKMNGVTVFSRTVVVAAQSGRFLSSIKSDNSLTLQYAQSPANNVQAAPTSGTTTGTWVAPAIDFSQAVEVTVELTTAVVGEFSRLKGFILYAIG